MIGYPVTYGDDLTQEQASKNLKEVQMGAMVVISLYLLSTQVANAAEGTPPPPGPSPVPAPVPGPGPGAPGICPAPQPSPNIIPKELLAGLVATFCSTAANTGNFWIGVGCGLLVLTAMKMARKD